MTDAPQNTVAPLHKEPPLPDHGHLPAGTLPTRIYGLAEGEMPQLASCCDPARPR